MVNEHIETLKEAALKYGRALEGGNRREFDRADRALMLAEEDASKFLSGEEVAEITHRLAVIGIALREAGI